MPKADQALDRAGGQMRAVAGFGADFLVQIQASQTKPAKAMMMRRSIVLFSLGPRLDAVGWAGLRKCCYLVTQAFATC